ATGTLWTSQTRSSAVMSGSWGCAVRGSLRKITPCTSPLATLAPICWSPPYGPDCIGSTARPVACATMRAVVPVPTRLNRWSSALCSRQKRTMSSFFLSWAMSASCIPHPLLPQRVHLAEGLLQAAGVVDDGVCPAGLLLRGHLGGDAPLSLLQRQPVACHQALELHLLGGVHHYGPVHPIQRDPGLEEKRDVADHHRLPLRLELLDLGPHAAADARVDDGLQRLSRLFVLEDDAGQPGAVELAVLSDHFRAKPLADLLQGGLSRFHHLAGQLVRVDDGGAQLLEPAHHRALAR